MNLNVFIKQGSKEAFFSNILPNFLLAKIYQCVIYSDVYTPAELSAMHAHSHYTNKTKFKIK